MTPPYRNGFEAALYYLAIAGWLVSEITIGVRASRRVGDRRDDRFSGPVLASGMFFAVWFGTFLGTRVPGAAIPSGRSVIFVAGVIVALAGIVIRQYAVATLGRYFSTRVMTTPDQHVVDAGLYRYVRHPSYTGLLLTVLGLLLCSTNWLSLACFLVALPGFAYRIRVEEDALVRALGEPYRTYMRRTKRLVPFLV